MKLEVKMPDGFKAPEGCKAVLMKPKKGTTYWYRGEFVKANWDFETDYHICFIFKHTWPPSLKCAAISMDTVGFVAHIEKPEKSNGCWISNSGWCIHPSMFTDPLPALEVGECLFNPNFKVE